MIFGSSDWTDWTTTTDWTELNFNFTQELYGNKLTYDHIDTPHADLCFSDFTKTYSV